MVDYNNSAAVESLLKQLRDATKDCMYAEPDDYGMKHTPVDNVILGSFYDYKNWNSETEQVPGVRVNEYGLNDLAYTIINYDLISVVEDGSIDFENSNHPDVAKIISELIPQNILARARKNVLGENKAIPANIEHIVNLAEGLTRSMLKEYGKEDGENVTECVDMGQVKSCQDKKDAAAHRAERNEKNRDIETQIARLRRKLGDEEDEKEVKKLQKEIDRFKKKLVEGVDSVESFYQEEDYDGNVGQPGMVRSYDIGWNSSIDSFQHSAKEEGLSLEEFLTTWWNEVSDGIPWRWQRLGSGYGFHGDTILELGNVVFKNIYDQLMVDEHAPKAVRESKQWLKRNESRNKANGRLIKENIETVEPRFNGEGKVEEGSPEDKKAFIRGALDKYGKVDKNDMESLVDYVYNMAQENGANVTKESVKRIFKEELKKVTGK